MTQNAICKARDDRRILRINCYKEINRCFKKFLTKKFSFLLDRYKIFGKNVIGIIMVKVEGRDKDPKNKRSA